MFKLLFIMTIVSGCSVLTTEDRQLVKDILQDSSGCVYIQGSGGAGASAVPLLPGAGGYGQGSIAAARSGQGHSAKCSSQGAEITKE